MTRCLRASRVLPIALAAAAAAFVAGCGGGGDDAPAAATTPAPLVVSGTAASGAAFSGATVNVLDATGKVVGTDDTVGDDGRYSVTLPAGTQGPLVIIATRSADSGETETLVSMLDQISGAVTVNVTPVTTLVAARLSPSGNPALLADELKAGSAKIDAATLQAKVAEVQELLKPLLGATDTAAVDPIKGEFKTDGTGYDRLLDSLQVSITPAGSQTNVEIGLKVQGSEQPPVVRFNSAQKIEDIKADANNQAVLAAAIQPAQLVAEGTNAKIQAFLARFNDCLKLPVGSRVSSGDGPSAVTAPQCRSLFADDDPASYLSNGAKVGRGQAWGLLFNDFFTKTVFSQGSYEFTRANAQKDLVIAYKRKATSGAEVFESVVVRDQAGVLKLIGNQYVYPGSVMPYQQLRRFVTLGQSDDSYYSSGYVLSVSNLTNFGQPLFDRVEVTAPNGRKLLLRPLGSTGNLGLVNAGNVTLGTSFVRLRASYLNAATAGNPAGKDQNLIFASPQYTEDELRAIPAQGVWKFSYYLASDPSTPAAEQNYRTRARAMTIEEFKALPLPGLDGATLDGLNGAANVQGAVPITAGQSFGPVTWQVPAGALPPTAMTLWGTRVAGVSSTFNDGTTFASTTRSGTVNCSPATGSDAHCSGSGPAFGSSNFATGISLQATDMRGRTLDVFHAMYKLP